MNYMPHNPDAEPARDEHRARVERHMAGLKELAELGMELARALALKGMQQAAVGDDGAVEAERSFSRVTRAVRLTMALEARLSEGLLKLDEPQKNNGWDPAEFEGAALRFRQKLARLAEAAGEREAAEADREETERRERGDREQLVETERDGDDLEGAWASVTGPERHDGDGWPSSPPVGPPPPLRRAGEEGASEGAPPSGADASSPGTQTARSQARAPP